MSAIAKPVLRITWEYRVHPSDIDEASAASFVEACENEDHARGACTKLIVWPIQEYSDGSRRHNALVVNGLDAQPLDAEEIFHVWALMADGLRSELTLPPSARALCERVAALVMRLSAAAQAAADAERNNVS